jgi:hypothetical protein
VGLLLLVKTSLDFIHFWCRLDCIATISLIPDIAWFVGPFLSLYNLTNVAGSKSSSTISRASRIFRLVRLIRLLRVVNLTKLFAKSKKSKLDNKTEESPEVNTFDKDLNKSTRLSLSTVLATGRRTLLSRRVSDVSTSKDSGIENRRKRVEASRLGI